MAFAQPSALGLASSPTDLSPVVTPIAPQLDPLGAAPTTAPAEIPEIDEEDERPLLSLDNPLAAIGAVMQNIARGARGQTLYTDELKERRMKQEAFELDRLSVGVDAMGKGMELLLAAPPEERGALAQKFGGLYEKVIPGFTDMLVRGTRAPQATQAQLEALGEHRETLISMTGNIPDALELASKPAFIEMLDKQADRRNLPEITAAFNRIGEVMAKSDEGGMLVRKAAEDGWTVTDLQDTRIQKALGLTPSHVATIARNAEIQSTLRPMGFIPTTDLDKQGEVKAGLKPLDRIAAESNAATAGSESAKQITYQHIETGVVERAAQGSQAAMKARGFEPVVTGRTPEDAAAATARKQEGKDAERGDAYINRVMGLPPEATRGEQVAAGLDPNLSSETKHELQAMESGMSSAKDTTDKLLAMVAENPDVNTWGAAAVGMFENLRANLTSFGRVAGLDWVKTIDKDMAGLSDLASSELKKYGIDNTLFRSLILDLTYMQALSRGQKGQGLSNADVEKFAKIVGQTQNDPEQLRTILDDVTVRFDQAFRNHVKAKIGGDPGSRLPDIQAAEAIAEKLNANEFVSPGDMMALSPRAKRALLTMRKK